MTGEMIALVVGFVVSILLEIIPGLNLLWTSWRWRRATLLGMSLAIPLIAWQLVCRVSLSLPGEYICTSQGVLETFITSLVAFAGSQTGYLMVARQSVNARRRHPA